MADSSQTFQKLVNEMASAMDVIAKATAQLVTHGSAFLLRGDDGDYVLLPPDKYKLVLADLDGETEEKEVDHGSVVMYRVVLMDHEPAYVPPHDISDSLMADAVIVQAIYQDGFMEVVKNRYGDELRKAFSE